MYDLIIIGGGIVTFGAALYAGRFHMKTLVLSENPGGTVVLTNEIENYPGFEKIGGQELFDKVRNHAVKYGIEVSEEKVERVDKKDGHFLVETVEKAYDAKTVLIATGSEWKKLGVPGEKEFKGNGVHYCALCDGYAYNQKTIAVVGGSDSAATEAVMLTQYAQKVYIIYRKEKVRAEPINLKRVEENDKIEIINNTMVMEIKGEKDVKSVILDREYKGSKELPLDGVFINIGHVPVSTMFKGLGLELTPKGEIKVDRYGMTNVQGIFAAGDVTDSKFKQIITGVAQGVAAVYSAYHCCKGETIKTG